MELNVYARGNVVGTCTIEDQGLYWTVHCICRKYTAQPVRLYGAGCNLGIIEPQRDHLVLHRKVSKSGLPGFPPKTECVLRPVTETTVEVCGIRLSGDVADEECGTNLYIPFENDQTHPCISLMCFWYLRNGFWVLSLNNRGEPTFPEDTCFR